eukprot:GSMAST32.ASY1.ANO1.1081.1 assembled CDS
MIVFFLVLLGVTTIYEPHLLHNIQFWKTNGIKLFIICFVSLCGGALCRCYCDVDEHGYILTSKASWFKVNYTRKFQHFAAYAVPLISSVTSSLGRFFYSSRLPCFDKTTSREFLTFYYLWMFNSLDRPEDRPNVLLWIIGGNILPGLCMIVFFNWLFSSLGIDQQKLVMIFVLVVRVGDGLAEPVGIYTGKHKYATRSCTSSKLYVNFKWSSCVFLTTFLWIEAYWWAIPTQEQFWTLMLILPITMYVYHLHQIIFFNLIFFFMFLSFISKFI